MFDMFKPTCKTLSKRARRAIRKAIECQDAKDIAEYNEMLAYEKAYGPIRPIAGGSVNTLPMGRTDAVDTGRGESAAIWYDCPQASIRDSLGVGMKFEDDMTMVGNAVMSSAYTESIGQWSAYGYAGATITDAQKEGGVVQLQADGDNEGLAIYSSTGSFRLVTTSTLALNRKLWYECRVARSTITTDKIDVFAGLMTPELSSGLPASAIPITTTDDTLSTTPSFLGFHSNSNTATRGGPTEVAVAFNLAAGTINYPTNCTTLMGSTGNDVLTAGGFVKLGFRFDPDGPLKRVSSATARQTAGTIRRALIRFFVNNLELPTFLSSEDVANATAAQAFPTGFMTPVFAMMNTAAAGGTFDIDWVKCFQLANS